MAPKTLHTYLGKRPVLWKRMRFGEQLNTQLVEEWRDYYLDYDKLKKMIKQLEESFVSKATNTGEKGTAQSRKVCDHVNNA
jgi:SPX domain protein involved in polyphosphate accumulation